MAEKSLFWFTDGFTGDVGDGGAPYTQEEFRLFNHAWAAKNQANVGVFPGVLNELAVSGSSSPLSVNTGRAIVYGFPYWTDSAVSLAVATPSGGTTGGRVVLRASWAAQTVRAVVIMSADGTATIPSMTQSAGVTWDIPLFTFTITTGGAITLTDAREWVAPLYDDTTIGINGSQELEVKDNSIDDLKVGNRVAQFYRRQGGSATDWSSQGSTTYTPTTVRVQVGTVAVVGVGATAVTFPTAFSNVPIVLVTAAGSDVTAAALSVTETGFSARINEDTSATPVNVFWMAIGSE